MNEFRGTLNEFWKTLAPPNPSPRRSLTGLSSTKLPARSTTARPDRTQHHQAIKEQ